MELRAALAEQAGHVEEAVNTLFSVAETWTVQLKKREMALAAYDKILNVDPKNRLAFEQLRSLAKELGDWRRYTTTSDRFLPAVTDPAEHLALLKETAQLQIEKLGQKDLAFITYCRAFRQQPHDAEVRAALNTLAGENEGWEELSMVYEEVAENAPKGPVAELAYAGLAGIQDEHLDEPERRRGLAPQDPRVRPRQPHRAGHARQDAQPARQGLRLHRQPGAEARGLRLHRRAQGHPPRDRARPRRAAARTPRAPSRPCSARSRSRPTAPPSTCWAPSSSARSAGKTSPSSSSAPATSRSTPASAPSCSTPSPRSTSASSTTTRPPSPATGRPSSSTPRTATASARWRRSTPGWIAARSCSASTTSSSSSSPTPRSG